MSLYNLSMQRFGGQIDFHPNNIPFPDVFSRGKEVLRPRHKHLLPSYVSKSITICIKSNRRIQRGLSSCPTHSYMTSRFFCRTCIAPFSFRYSACNLAFPIPSALPYSNISFAHSESLFCGDMLARVVKEHMCGGVFEV